MKPYIQTMPEMVKGVLYKNKSKWIIGTLCKLEQDKYVDKGLNYQLMAWYWYIYRIAYHILSYLMWYRLYSIGTDIAIIVDIFPI